MINVFFPQLPQDRHKSNYSVPVKKDIQGVNICNYNQLYKYLHLSNQTQKDRYISLLYHIQMSRIQRLISAYQQILYMMQKNVNIYMHIK